MLILLVLSAGFCLATGQAQYSLLSTGLKSYVDMALVKANRELDSNGHLNFHRIGDSAVVGPWVNVDVELKNTVCRKQAEHKHRPECLFKRLEVRCRVCGRAGRHPMFIDCVRMKFLDTRVGLWAQNCPLCDASCLILFAGSEQQAKMPPPALPSQ